MLCFKTLSQHGQGGLWRGSNRW